MTATTSSTRRPWHGSRSTGRGLRWNKWERTVTGNHRAGRHICRPYEPADDLRHSETTRRVKTLPTGLQKPSPLGEGGPAGPDEGGKPPGSSRLPIMCGPGVPGPYEPADDLRHSEANAEGSRPLPTGLQKPFPLWGKVGPAGRMEGNCPAAAVCL